MAKMRTSRPLEQKGMTRTSAPVSTSSSVSAKRTSRPIGGGTSATTVKKLTPTTASAYRVSTAKKTGARSVVKARKK